MERQYVGIDLHRRSTTTERDKRREVPKRRRRPTATGRETGGPATVGRSESRGAPGTRVRGRSCYSDGCIPDSACCCALSLPAEGVRESAEV